MASKKEAKASKSRIFPRNYLIAGLLLVMALAAYNNERLSWHFSAAGRIFMGKLLPFWDWQKLYNRRCLIQKASEKPSPPKTRELECSVCENFHGKSVERLRNTSFGDLEERFVIRGLPVIVEDAQDSVDFREFCTKLLKTDDFVSSEPCSLKTNLALKQWVTLETVLRSVQENPGFLHFRNCEFEAVKSTRRLHPKPYFYEPHLAPSHSTWMLLSHNFSAAREIDLEVVDLVMVKQLQGKLEVTLEGKRYCLEKCGRHVEELRAGEALVFLSELWDFSYRPVDGNYSLSVVTETFFK